MSDKTSRAQRRLAAIVFCDMVGYSRLMEESESHALQLLGEYRQVVGKTIQEHSGEIIDTIGDGWKDADADLPLLADARERLGALEARAIP